MLLIYWAFPVHSRVWVIFDKYATCSILLLSKVRVLSIYKHQNWLKHLSEEEEKVWIDQIPRWNLENRSKSRMGTGLPSIEASTTTSLTCHTNSFVCATKRFLFFLNSNLRAISCGHFFEARSIFENFPDLAPGDTGVKSGRQGTGLVLFFSTSLNFSTSLTILFTLV